jgi:RHS repeat-associated protein
LTTVTDQNSGVKTYVWDTVNNRISSIKDERNNTLVSLTYDGNGRVATQTLVDSSTFGFAYTLSGSTVTRTDVTDRRGSVRKVEFSGSGYITKNTFPVGLAEEQVTNFTVDSTTGRVTAMTDALSRQTTYQYDSLGNATQVTQLAGTGNAVSTTYTYDPNFSLPLTVTDPNSKTTTFTRDNRGNLTQISDPLSHTTQFTYDPNGRVLTVVDGLSHTVATMAYNGADLSTVTDALSRTTSFYTDGVGRVTGIKDPLGVFATKSYDVLDRVTQLNDALGGTIQFTYDAHSNLLTHVDQKSNTTTYTYDTFNRVATKQDALTRTESYAYETGGSLNKVTDRKSQVSGMTYDGLGRVTQIGYGATIGSPTTYTSTVTNTWDAGNRLTQIVDSVAGTITRTYDGLDRLTQESGPQGIVSYTYDAGGRRTSMTVTGQPAISYTWDDASRLTQIQQAAGGSNNNSAQTIGFTYDNANRRTVTTLANGSTVNYAWDNASQLSSITYKKADTTTIGDLTYTYDNAGRRTKASGSLAALDLPNTVSSTTYNANNQLTNWGGATYSYDLNGNLTGDGTNTYTWNERDQLASIATGVTASFSYDGFGRRIAKTISGTTTAFVYDGLNFVQEKDGTGGGANVTANLVTGLTLDDTYLRSTGTNPSAVLSHFLPDGNNNVIRLLNNSQTVTDAYSYEAYGKTTHGTGSNGNSQQFTGRENDGTGLFFYRARYYSPGAGRFVAEDPIGWASGQTNAYGYLTGDPIDFNDPLGWVNVDPNDPLKGAGGLPPVPMPQIRIQTPWGWSGQASFKAAAKELQKGGTIRDIGGRIPTEKQAELLLREAKCTPLRIEGPHPYPNPHGFWHINYSTPSGARGTIQIVPPE